MRRWYTGGVWDVRERFSLRLGPMRLEVAKRSPTFWFSVKSEIGAYGWYNRLVRLRKSTFMAGRHERSPKPAPALTLRNKYLLSIVHPSLRPGLGPPRKPKPMTELLHFLPQVNLRRGDD